MLTIAWDVFNDDDGDDDNYNGNGGEVMMEIVWVFVAMRTRSKPWVQQCQREGEG